MKKVWKWMYGQIKIMKRTKLIFTSLVGIFLVVIGLFLGVRYIGGVLFVGLLLFLSKMGNDENNQMVTPWDLDKKREEVEKMEKKANIIREHLQTNPQDLDAKMKLYELELEIEEMEHNN